MRIAVPKEESMVKSPKVELLFKPGNTYRNRLGDYRVLTISGPKMLVEYLANGRRQELDVAIAERIWENIQAEENPWPAPAPEGGTIVTLAHLRAGIQRWFSKCPPWPTDFHNAFYQALQALRDNGELSWDYLVDQLASWSAVRPYSKEAIYQLGLPHLDNLTQNMGVLVAGHGGRIPDLNNVRWSDLQPLFAVASQIKPSDSPVFAGKLCHFLLPNSYPVADNELVGIDREDYRSYWLRCAYGWTFSTQQNDLIAELRSAMTSAAIADYPWSAKITELCHIGVRYRQ
jgi:hypothetical protein